MFNLEQSIAEWRREMLAAGIKTPTPLEELESHLREDVEQKIRAGVGVKEAFQCAVRELGRGEGLQREFEKLENAKRMRTRELLARWSVIAGTAFVYVAMACTWWLGGREGKIEITRLEILFAAGAAVPMILLGQLGPVVARRLPDCGDDARSTFPGRVGISLRFPRAIAGDYGAFADRDALVSLAAARIWKLRFRLVPALSGIAKINS